MFVCVSDCFGWKEEVQCEFPADVPVDKGANILDIHRNHCDTDHTCSHDDTRHNRLHPCIYAYRLGHALGKLKRKHSSCWSLCYGMKLKQYGVLLCVLHRLRKRVSRWCIEQGSGDQ